MVFGGGAGRRGKSAAARECGSHEEQPSVLNEQCPWKVTFTVSGVCSINISNSVNISVNLGIVRI